jgi:maleate isomerase
VQDRIISNYRALGIDCVSERHLDIQDNFSFAEVPVETLAEMTRQVAGTHPDAIAIVCTNLRAVHLVAELEQDLGLPIYDTIATAVWDSLRLASVDPKRVRGWGGLFDLA